MSMAMSTRRLDEDPRRAEPPHLPDDPARHRAPGNAMSQACRGRRLLRPLVAPPSRAAAGLLLALGALLAAAGNGVAYAQSIVGIDSSNAITFLNVRGRSAGAKSPAIGAEWNLCNLNVLQQATSAQEMLSGRTPRAQPEEGETPPTGHSSWRGDADGSACRPAPSCRATMRSGCLRMCTKVRVGSRLIA